MTDCKTFHGVSQQIFDCVKKTSASQHGTKYVPPNGDKGTATTDTVVGTVVVSFDLNAGAESIQYCIVSKPWIVSAGEIFNGIADSINDCRAK